MLLFQSSIQSLPLVGRGKVRDIYAVGDDKLLIVTTDRLSAFDVVLPDPIPHKGHVLTEISNFWFARTGHIVPNQLTGQSLDGLPLDPDERALLEGRAVIVRRLKALPLDAQTSCMSRLRRSNCVLLFIGNETFKTV